MKVGNGAQLVSQMYLKVIPENAGALGRGKGNIRVTPTPTQVTSFDSQEYFL